MWSIFMHIDHCFWDSKDKKKTWNIFKFHFLYRIVISMATIKCLCMKKDFNIFFLLRFFSDIFIFFRWNISIFLVLVPFFCSVKAHWLHMDSFSKVLFVVASIDLRSINSSLSFFFSPSREHSMHVICLSYFFST